MNSDTRERALVNISDNQRTQKIVQDNRHVIMDKPLPIGTKVFIRSEGLIGKLEPRYKGPYKIARINHSGNYELQDSDNNLLGMSYPLHKLKVVRDPSDMTEESWEVDKVIDHRKKNKENEFLVRWKDCDESEDTWIKESNFNSTDPIKEYWNSIKDPSEKVQNMKRGRGRPRKYNIPNPNLLVKLIVFFSLFYSILGYRIDGNYKFCELQSSMKVIMDIENSCHMSDNVEYKSYFPVGNYMNISILHKNKHSVHGTGYQCKQIITTYTFSKPFPYAWQDTERKVSEEYTSTLRRADCDYMVKTKRCGDHPMTCDGEGCYVQYIPTKDDVNQWFGSVTKRGYTCTIRNRIITAEDADQKIFSSPNHPCTAKDLECPMSESIIIWEKTIVHSCPYAKVDSIEVKVRTGNKLTSDTVLFQLTKEVTECGIKLFETNEGLYISSDEKAKDLPKNTGSIEIGSFLAIAELDDHKWNFMKKLLHLDMKICTNFISTINTRRSMTNGFFSVYDVKGNKLTLLNIDGTIYIPDCKPIKTIYVDKTVNCFEDIPIIFMKDGKNQTGFIIEDNIIKRQSRKIDCGKMKNNSIIVSDKMISRKGNDIEIGSLDSMNIKIEKISKLNLNLSELNFKHSNSIIEAPDIISIVHDLVTVDEESGTRLTEKSLIDEITYIFANDSIHMLFLKLGKTGFILSIIGLTLIIIIIIILLWKFGICKLIGIICRDKKRNMKKKREKGRKTVTIEMKDLRKRDKDSSSRETSMENLNIKKIKEELIKKEIIKESEITTEEEVQLKKKFIRPKSIIIEEITSDN